MFNNGGDGCKGPQKLKEEQARQDKIDDLLHVDKMDQADTTFNIYSTAEINGNQIQNTNTYNW